MGTKKQENKVEDFGFSFVDDPNVKFEQQYLTEKSDLMVAKAEITHLNKTIGFYRQKNVELLSVVEKFLDKLKDTPEKEYIYWPNRVEKIDEFKDYLNDIMRTE